MCDTCSGCDSDTHWPLFHQSPVACWSCPQFVAQPSPPLSHWLSFLEYTKLIPYRVRNAQARLTVPVVTRNMGANPAAAFPRSPQAGTVWQVTHAQMAISQKFRIGHPARPLLVLISLQANRRLGRDRHAVSSQYCGRCVSSKQRTCRDLGVLALVLPWNRSSQRECERAFPGQ